MNNLENLATEIGKDIKDIKTRYATKQEMQEVAEKKQDKDTVYNDTEIKQRLTALENRPTGGGSQTQDTGWITISDDSTSHGNVVKIRRINDMVHVSLSNSTYDGLYLQNDSEESYVILANKEIPSGFKTLKSQIKPVTETEDDISFNPNHIQAIGLAIFKVVDNKVTLKVYGDNFSTNSSIQAHINDFSYFTEDPFPTNLH